MLFAHRAMALDACFADSAGFWRGPVVSGDQIGTVETNFSVAADGRLAATYHISVPDPYDGTLTDFTPTGPCEAVFVWHDAYGAGVVDIRFDPTHGRFDGEWGHMLPASGWLFDGLRLAPNS